MSEYELQLRQVFTLEAKIEDLRDEKSTLEVTLTTRLQETTLLQHHLGQKEAESEHLRSQIEQLGRMKLELEGKEALSIEAFNEIARLQFELSEALAKCKEVETEVIQ